jgi:hypothetical protein
MERLVVAFADRYLDAVRRFRAGERPSRCWAFAFETAARWRPLVLQHLILGINAHINLDLGIAAATVAPTPDELESLWPDFKTINEVLSRLVQVVEDELGEISPRLKRIEDIAPGLEDRIFDFGIDAARDFAWALAKELADTPPAGRDAVIAARDGVVAAVAGALYPLHGIPGHVQSWIHGAESVDVRYNIQVVAE